MGTVYYPQLTASRILEDKTREALAPDNSNAGVFQTAVFILAIQIDGGGRSTESSSYRIRWREAGGAYVYLSDSGALKTTKYSDALEADGALTLSEKRIDNIPADDVWQDGLESLNSAHIPSDSISTKYDLAGGCYTEIQVAIDSAGANVGVTYEFELYNSTEDTSVDACAASVTILELVLPAVVLDTADGAWFTTNQPSFSFTGTHPNGNRLAYEVDIIEGADDRPVYVFHEGILEKYNPNPFEKIDSYDTSSESPPPDGQGCMDRDFLYLYSAKSGGDVSLFKRNKTDWLDAIEPVAFTVGDGDVIDIAEYGDFLYVLAETDLDGDYARVTEVNKEDLSLTGLSIDLPYDADGFTIIADADYIFAGLMRAGDAWRIDRLTMALIDTGAVGGRLFCSYGDHIYAERYLGPGYEFTKFNKETMTITGTLHADYPRPTSVAVDHDFIFWVTSQTMQSDAHIRKACRHTFKVFDEIIDISTSLHHRVMTDGFFGYIMEFNHDATWERLRQFNRDNMSSDTFYTYGPNTGNRNKILTVDNSPVARWSTEDNPELFENLSDAMDSGGANYPSGDTVQFTFPEHGISDGKYIWRVRAKAIETS